MTRSNMCSHAIVCSLLLAVSRTQQVSSAFVNPSIKITSSDRTRHRPQQHNELYTTNLSSSGKGFAMVDPPSKEIIRETLEITKKPTSVSKIGTSSNDETTIFSTLSTEELKSKLVPLVSRTTGKREELEEISALVNALEEKYEPVQTLDFMNMAMAGEWQLLFTTNRLSVPHRNLRLRELIQRVEPDGKQGVIINEAQWDLTEDPSMPFQFSGSLSIKSSYRMEQYPRLEITLEDHILQPKGKVIPDDIEGLFQSLHRAIPMELFDPNLLGMDTTYLDGEMRIVRLTGDRCEGVRDIFIRKDTLEIDPGL